MFTLGIDLGGTFARAAVIAGDGRLVAVAKHALDDRRPEAVVEAIAHAVEQVLESTPGIQVEACGVGVAAQLNPANGRVRVAPNLGWRDVPLGELLAVRLRRPVRLINDLSAAAYGEYRAGAGRGERELLTVFVGSGVGSAIIAGGQLVHGASGVAAEFGHIKVVPGGGRRCGCGELGCLEAYVGGHNLIEQAQELVAAGESPRLLELAGGDPDRLNPVLLERAALEGDPASLRIYERARGFLAVAVANYVTVLNPARLILGGGVLTHCPGLKRAVVEGVAAYASRVSNEGFRAVDALLGDDSGLMGAGLMAAQLTLVA